MTAVATFISRINSLIARCAAWSVLLMVALYFAIVVLRYGFDWGAIALQESVVYLHALLFMGAAAGVLAQDGHVRVDVFYSRFSPARQALVNLLGALLFLLPFAGFLLWSAWDYVGEAWARNEGSSEPGGLPFVYLLKSLILVLAVQLALQALAQALAALTQLRGTRT